MDSYGTRSLREIVRILFSHLLMIIIILVIGGVGTWFVCENFAPRKYRSQVSLIYKRPANKNPVQSDVAGERALEVFVKAQQQILMSDLVLARAKVISEDSHLREEWKKLQQAWNDARHSDSGSVTEQLQATRDFLTSKKVDGKVDKLMKSNQQDLIDFRKSVKLETPGGEQVGMTETFQVTVDRPGKNTDPSYLNAQYAADAVADMYIARYQELQNLQNEPGLRVMDEVVATYKQELDKRRKAYDDFIQANVEDITGLEQLLKSGAEQGLQIALSEIRKNDATLALELAKDQAIYEAIKKVLPEKVSEKGFLGTLNEEATARLVDAVASEFMSDDVTFVELSKNLANLKTKEAKVESQFLEDSKDVQYIKQQLVQVRKQMLGQIIARVHGLELRVASRLQQKARNEQLVHQFEKDQNKVHSKLVQYVWLKNEFDSAQKQLQRLEQDRIDAMTGELAAREVVSINKLDNASTPDKDKPVVPLTVIYTIVACAVSLLIGVTLAFLADHFDHTLRSTLDAERYLGVPVLGSVKRRGRRIIVPG